jgi:outer membrane biosynthesis protein TonB
LRTRAALASFVPSPAKKHVTAALVASVLVLLLVGGAASSRSWGENERTIVPAATLPGVPSNQVVPAVPEKKVIDSAVDPRAAVVEPTEKVPAARPRVAEEHPSSRKAAEKKVEAKPIAIPTLSTAISSRLDSVAAKAASAPTQSGDSFAVPGAAVIAARRGSFGESQVAASQRARLIGELPTPQVPASVSEVQGEVVVRFTVGTDGRPVMPSFTVVKSPNPALSMAVQKEIPALRFEPARSGGSDPKVVTDVVEIAYKFSKSSH